VKSRTLGAVLAAVLATTCLAACRTNVGAAARVDDSRITESDVNDYILPQGPDPSAVANAQQQGQTVPSPRSFVLENLVKEKVFEQTLASIGSLPTSGQLASYHDVAARVLFQTQLTGPALEAALRKALPRSGITAKFAGVYVRVSELEYALIKAKNLSRLPQLIALIKKAHVRVWVNPRYGKWDKTTISIDGAGSLPSYLEPQPGQQGAAANAG
jgi:hypothetical protein